MKTHRMAAPVPARPLAPASALLVIAVMAHALVVGCGGKEQASNAGDGSGTSVASPAPTAAGPGTAATVAAGDAAGATVYAARCALCHGPQGKGDGPAAAALNPKPRNHTDGTYMNSRTDEDLLTVIRDGKGAMPKWGGILTEDEIQAALKHVRTLAK